MSIIKRILAEEAEAERKALAKRQADEATARVIGPLRAAIDDARGIRPNDPILAKRAERDAAVKNLEAASPDLVNVLNKLHADMDRLEDVHRQRAADELATSASAARIGVDLHIVEKAADDRTGDTVDRASTLQELRDLAFGAPGK